MNRHQAFHGITWLLGLALLGAAVHRITQTPVVAELDALQSVLDTTGELLVELQEQSAPDPETLVQALPEAVSMPELLAMLHAAARDAGVTDLVLRMPTAAAEDDELMGFEAAPELVEDHDPAAEPLPGDLAAETWKLEPLITEVELQGSYAQTAHFLAALERLRPLTRVRNLQIAAAVSDRVEVELTVVTYTVRPESPEPLTAPLEGG